MCASEPESAGLSAWDHVPVKWCACVQPPELKVSEVKNDFYSVAEISMTCFLHAFLSLRENGFICYVNR